jgi:hypothetical protein
MLFAPDSELSTYEQQNREVDLGDIKLVEDINRNTYGAFYAAGAQTTLWDKQMRPIHVVQPRDLIEQFRIKG